MSIARHHAEWLSLLDISGPFLSLPVLLRALPQGLDAHDADVTRVLRLAYEEWLDSTAGLTPDAAIHRAWVEWVVRTVLEMPDAVIASDPTRYSVTIAEYHEPVVADIAICEPPGFDDTGGNGRGAGDGAGDGMPAKPRARLLVHIIPPGADLEKPLAGTRWKATPATRMMTLLHATGVRLGIVTNGEQWMLVDAPREQTTGFISWYAQLWLDEPLTLRAFRTLVCARRFFGVDERNTLEALLADSVDNQQEVTDQLGYQVRRAVELLVQAMDLADQDHQRRLLADLDEQTIYQAALTIMMRLVFVLAAEERDMLLLGDPIYDQYYAISTMRDHLRALADQVGEEVVERRCDAWSRLLTTFRAIHRGIFHDRLMLPAYGGNLFDPDRYPWLEQGADGAPIPINNRTILYILESLQLLQVKIPGGGPAEARRLSFRALDIEQIGHVYEGLLDHTVVRATEPVLGIAGTRDHEPEIALAELEARVADEKQLVAYLREQTGRSAQAITKDIERPPTDALWLSRLRGACGNDESLYARVVPFAGVIRLDAYNHPFVILPGSYYVTTGTERRATGTHYTPRSLTEPVVQYTLEPLVYSGPVEGKPREEWQLCSPEHILSLTVCDMAMGSGAFLVQACRYLAERLVESFQGIGNRDQGVQKGIGNRDQGIGSAAHGAVQNERPAQAATPDPCSLTPDPSVDNEEQYDNTNILRSDGLAEEHGLGRGDVSDNQSLPEGGNVRANQPVAEGSGFGPVKYRGRLRESTSQGIHPSSLDSSRVAMGGRDTVTNSDATGVHHARTDNTSMESCTGSGADAQFTHALIGESEGLGTRVQGLQEGLGTRVQGIGAAKHGAVQHERPTQSATPDPCSLFPVPSVATPDPYIEALRLVAGRCLYGVDKNPLAVEMAKLSLWLITMDRGRPFTFLDHALRCGDSLLGVSVEQLRYWTLDVETARREGTHTFLTYPIQRALERARGLRRRIHAMGEVVTVHELETKAHMLRQADEAMALVKLAADLLAASVVLPDKEVQKGIGNRDQGIGTAAHGAVQNERPTQAATPDPCSLFPIPSVALPRERFLNYAQHRVQLLAEAWEDMHAGRFTAEGERPAREDFAHLRAEADQWLDGVRPFHWELEFPEVFSECQGIGDRVLGIGDRVLGIGDRVQGIGGAGQRAVQNSQDAQATDPIPSALFPVPSAQPGFSAIIGNPPFMGGQRITGALGTPYRDYLVEHLAGGTRGSADLCAYFFLRSRAVLQPGGMAGLLATNTIAQGDTREVGLDQLVQKHGYTIPRAVPSRPWPGAAGVVVAHIWLRRGRWRTPYVLDDTPVHGITPYLTVPGKAVGTPYRLAANAGKSFIGSYVLGMGFVLEPDEAQALIDKDPRNKDVLFPYLNGEDINSRPDQSPRRWVINFFDWSLEEAEHYPDCMAIVREKVKPQRMAQKDKFGKDYWWRFLRTRPELHTAIAGMKRVLIRARIANKHAMVYVPNGWVYNEKTVVFVHCSFALLQSNIHEVWAREYSSSLKSDMQYTPSDCFETFPFPSNAQGIGEAEGRGIRDQGSGIRDQGIGTANQRPSQNSQPTQQTTPTPSKGIGDRGLGIGSAGQRVGQNERPAQQTDPTPYPLHPIPSLEEIGERYHEHRRQIMLARQEGLTKTYNRFHNPDEMSEDIALLRALHVQMDEAVAAAYGWGDLDLGHGFHETKQGVRYTICEAARREVLDRLLALNHERHAAEAEGIGGRVQGVGSAKGKGTRGKRKKKGEQGELF